MTRNANILKSEQKQIASKKKKRTISEHVHSFLDGSFIAQGKIRGRILFLLFLVLLGLGYIRNNYLVERTIRKLNKLNNELVELHYDYIQMKSTVNLRTQPSVLEEELQAYNIKRLERPPIKIFLQP
ncbi:MAG: FtsL-like putative cell division protein [Bacteroidales bacterium]|jgi:hypothetical protein|nr:hypothetical protein [Bacteroidales bacterium]MDI9593390.1 FtsL-like putative cell division protein [Bacteroidota bacterium]NLH33580.1 hypothetical protein [Lentimicrobium sp.]OQC36583.1 MAG: hypothetical protein BWX63_01780 [Bacteroidetes bacterium ADurb.Bin041]MBP7874551.1 hypothetical protein [Bacteroidales bacterium]